MATEKKMATEKQIKELTTQIEQLSFVVEELTNSLKGEFGANVTDAILFLSYQMELARKKTEA